MVYGRIWNLWVFSQVFNENQPIDKPPIPLAGYTQSDFHCNSMLAVWIKIKYLHLYNEYAFQRFMVNQNRVGRWFPQVLPNHIFSWFFKLKCSIDSINTCLTIDVHAQTYLSPTINGGWIHSCFVPSLCHSKYLFCSI